MCRDRHLASCAAAQLDRSATPPISMRAAGRPVQPAHQIEQRRLARSRRAHQREELALLRRRAFTPFRTSMRSLPRVKCLWTSRMVTSDIGQLLGSQVPLDLDLSCRPRAPAAATARHARRRCRPASTSSRSPSVPPVLTARRSTASAVDDEHDRSGRRRPDRRSSAPARPGARRRFGAADHRALRRSVAGAARNVTLTPMSGRMRGSSSLKPMRTSTVAFCAIGRRHRRDDDAGNLPVRIRVEHGRRRPVPASRG